MLRVWLMPKSTARKGFSFLRLYWLGDQQQSCLTRAPFCNSVLQRRLKEESEQDKPDRYIFLILIHMPELVLAQGARCSLVWSM